LMGSRGQELGLAIGGWVSWLRRSRDSPWAASKRYMVRMEQ
jgi:hypothetical protein